MTPDTIQQTIRQGDTALLIELLEDKQLPIEIVKTIYFAFHDHKELVSQVAMNLSLRTSVYNREQEYSDTMVELLRDIAANPVDMGARWAVAKNPHTPVDVLKILANDDVNLVRALVGANPSTPGDVLARFFNDEKIVRDALSGNPNTPLRLLKILGSDHDKMVRMRLCENPAVTKEILQTLQNDDDSDVAKAAEVHLGKCS